MHYSTPSPSSLKVSLFIQAGCLFTALHAKGIPDREIRDLQHGVGAPCLAVFGEVYYTNLHAYQLEGTPI